MNVNYANIVDNTSNIIFITGGTKSGKSELAEHLAKKVKKLINIKKEGQKIGN